MTTTVVSGARHRAARRPSTPLSSLGQSLTGPAARRGLAAAASSGLVLTMAATSAGASTGSTTAMPKVDISSVTAEALTAMVTTPSVTVPASVVWSVEPLAARATPAPERAILAERATPVASRTGERADLATVTAEATGSAAAETATDQVAAPAPLGSASALISFARQFVGTPYVYGGSTPGGFDCSGFTKFVFAELGINLPRSSGAQAAAGTAVSAAEARPGDLVWWPGHVGIYTGGGNHIAARQPGTALAEGPITHTSPTFIRIG
ncbi:C40 family peptidase [Georgenia sp. SYP-B2076]|uniref:C40 family peptidase n=1 Tax=Georgenia sp. SYP-B2076 TaxID=2495881 RepID=UPI001F0C4059|nr:C40 family peptidase [Georgenia sp. SYP-B2076]